MADSFLDTAGGLQQVPTVNVVEKPAQPYVATDGSMQSAVAVNVLSGGIPADGVAVTDGEAVSILNSDGSAQLAQGTADIDTSTDPNTLEGITLPANYAVIQDGADNIDVLDFGAGGGMVAGIARVANNSGDVQLANATTKIAINAAPITIADQHGRTAGATIAVDQGNWQNFPLINATDTVLSVGAGIEISIQSGTSGIGGTFQLNGSAPRAVLPPNAALVANNVDIQVPVTGTYVDTITPQVDATGTITGFVLS
ncbi:MAG TPA: hypothetical protein VNS34_10635 [Rhizobiaceae bacterium]|nr:hypothetical protein [Rhizobiaceae bacterium]